MTSDASFRTFLVRVTLTHMVTYTVAGLLAYTLIDYPMLFQAEGFAGLMRPVTSKWVAAGPALQVIRGLIFAMALYPFRRVFLEERGGWLPLWGLLLGLCVFSTAAAAPGSIEGLIYTTIPPALQMRGLPEVVLQTLAFSLIVCAWYRNPRRSWAVVMGVLAVLVVLISAAGIFAPRPSPQLEFRSLRPATQALHGAEVLDH